MHLPVENICHDRLQSALFTEKGVSLTVARLDRIHATVSGNKLFKLHYFVEECLRSEHKTILTFGGAYSNHLAAAAFLCRKTGLKAIGIIRGEAPKKLSHTLAKCLELGMQLEFVSRSDYKNADAAFIKTAEKRFGKFTFVPEGGYDAKGARGAALISDLVKSESATHICTAVGTATTLAGLFTGRQPGQIVIGVPVIKNMTDIPARLQHLTGTVPGEEIEIFDQYHFGGYAKYDEQLTNFMNDFYRDFSIPTDFVYTAKMMYAVIDMIKKDHFPPGSRIVCVHTGGLQGNDSLPAGKLIF